MSIIAKYKFDHNVYADLVPVFNDGYSGYSITDEIAEDGSYTIRTIECDSLPTVIYFGLHNTSNTPTAREESLLSIEYLDVSQCTNLAQLCRYCYNIEHVNCADWDTSNVESMLWLFEGCNKLKSVDIRNWDTSNVTQIGAIFSGCTSITSVDMSLWNTSKVTNLMYLFATCSSLITIDISNMVISEGNSLEGFITACTLLKYIKCNISNTIQTILPYLSTRTSDDPGTIIYQGAETLSSDLITELQAKNWNIVTSPQLIAKYKYDSTIYKNLIPVFNEGYMGFVEDEEVDENGIVTRVIEHVELPTLMRFGQVYVDSEIVNNQSKSLLQVLDMNISELTTFNSMFRHCNNLVGVTCVWDIHPSAINMNNMFQYCYNLSELDMSNCNVSKVNLMFAMFNHCYRLHNLDLSRWDMSNVSNMGMMFHNCQNLSRLDISNLDTSNKITDTMLNNTLILTDIGMIYCNKETVNKVASLLPNNIHRTIWVESDDILQYDQYDHITYKTQKVQDTVHLNSPLLMGDTIEVIDGKTYHVHRWEKVVLDGSETWTNITTYDIDNLTCFTASVSDKITGSDNGRNSPNTVISSHFNAGSYGSTATREAICIMDDYKGIRIKIDKSRLAIPDTNGLEQWLQQNNVEVIYILDTPYYELISEEPLELTLLDTTDNTINNNSILPSNMTIANKELSTIAIKPSTTYTLSFDKSNEDSEVTIDICGGEQITTVLNRAELTTPSELGSGIRFISSDGCIISNVRLLEGTLVGEEIPKESFEGLKNSFEDNVVTQAMVDSGEESEENLGKYKVEYKVTGKNLINKEWELLQGIYNDSGEYVDDSTSSHFANYIKIKADISHTVQYVQRVYFYDDNFEWISRTNNLNAQSVTLNIPSNCKYVRIQIYNEWLTMGMYPQLEEGTVATEYEPYKEDIKTYYLSSPFLEGDTIEDVSGVATHVKRYEKVVLDGSNYTNKLYTTSEITRNNTLCFRFETLIALKYPILSNNFISYETNSGNVYRNDVEGVSIIGSNNSLVISVDKSRLSTQDVDGFKQWLHSNPTTVVYKLASPIYETISTESILLDSYTNGHLDLSNENIPIQKTEFRNFTKELAYLQPSTDYIVRFSSDNIGIAKVYLDSSVKEINVVQGINEVIITTPSTIVNNNIIIDGIGFNVSNVQVIANAIEDGDIKDFDYFKGLQSSFEDGLVTDENDENYGKYKVECKIVGKNKFDINKITTSSTVSIVDNRIHMNGAYGACIGKLSDICNLQIGKTYRTKFSYNVISGDGLNVGAGGQIRFFKKENNSFTSYIFPDNVTITQDILDNYYILVYGSTEESEFYDIQIEEGTVATEYEPYKESIYTLYLNSPLLKGDKLVVHEGKLCHYHKMGMVVLDGSESWVRESWSDILRFKLIEGVPKCLGGRWSKDYSNLYIKLHGDQSGIEYFRLDNNINTHVLYVYKINLNLTLDEFKKGLQANPTTVVYELAEPYYEPIEPQISQYSFSTVKEGDMELITALPIEIDLTYRTDINGVSSIEEQIASIQEGTDISDIIDEEVDE